MTTPTNSHPDRGSAPCADIIAAGKALARRLLTSAYAATSSQPLFSYARDGSRTVTDLIACLCAETERADMAAAEIRAARSRIAELEASVASRDLSDMNDPPMPAVLASPDVAVRVVPRARKLGGSVAYDHGDAWLVVEGNADYVCEVKMLPDESAAETVDRFARAAEPGLPPLVDRLPAKTLAAAKTAAQAVIAWVHP